MDAEIFQAMAVIQDRHWWFAARRRILHSVMSNLALPQSAKILEVGCGTGGNLAMLSKFGDLSAMECDDSARSVATSLSVCPVAAGGLPEPMPFEDKQFDLVCLLDVLEHIENDEEALARLERLLRPDGRMLVTVPAYAWLWSTHDKTHHHYRRYTAGMLRRKGQRANLIVEKIGYFNTLLFPIIAMTRLIGKITGSHRDSDATMPISFINQVLTGIFSFERFLVPRVSFPFGVSIFAVLSKSP